MSDSADIAQVTSKNDNATLGKEATNHGVCNEVIGRNENISTIQNHAGLSMENGNDASDPKSKESNSIEVNETVAKGRTENEEQDAQANSQQIAPDFDDLLDAFDTEVLEKDNKEEEVGLTASSVDKTPPFVGSADSDSNPTAVGSPAAGSKDNGSVEIGAVNDLEKADSNIEMLSAYAEESFGEATMSKDKPHSDAVVSQNHDNHDDEALNKKKASPIDNLETGETESEVAADHLQNTKEESCKGGNNVLKTSDETTSVNTASEKQLPSCANSNENVNTDVDSVAIAVNDNSNQLSDLSDDKRMDTPMNDVKRTLNEQNLDNPSDGIVLSTDKQDADLANDDFELSVDDSDMGSLCIDLNEDSEEKQKSDSISAGTVKGTNAKSSDKIVESVELGVISKSQSLGSLASECQSPAVAAASKPDLVNDQETLTSLDGDAPDDNDNLADPFDIWNLGDSDIEDESSAKDTELNQTDSVTNSNKPDNTTSEDNVVGEKDPVVENSDTQLAQILSEPSSASRQSTGDAEKVPEKSPSPLAALQQITDLASTSSKNQPNSSKNAANSHDQDDVTISSVKTSGANKRKIKEPVKSSSKFEKVKIKEEKIDSDYHASSTLYSPAAANNTSITPRFTQPRASAHIPIRPGLNQPLGRPPVRFLPNTARIVNPNDVFNRMHAPQHANLAHNLNMQQRLNAPNQHQQNFNNGGAGPQLIWNPNLNRLVLVPQSSSGLQQPLPPTHFSIPGQRHAPPPNVQVLPNQQLGVMHHPPGAPRGQPPATMTFNPTTGRLVFSHSPTVTNTRPPITVLPATSAVASLRSTRPITIIPSASSVAGTMSATTVTTSGYNVIRVPSSRKTTSSKSKKPPPPSSSSSTTVTNMSATLPEGRGNIEMYVPQAPPEELGLGETWVKPAFSCKECGDSFWFKSSLRHHLERRSMLVNFFCHPCNKKLAFVNKCACLNHRLLHKQDAASFSASNNAVISVLPRHMMPESPKLGKLPAPGGGEGSKDTKQAEAGGGDSAKKAVEKDADKAAGKEDVVLVEDEEQEQEQPTSTDTTPQKNAAAPTPSLPAGPAPAFTVSSRLELVERFKRNPALLRAELKVDEPKRCPECKRMMGSTRLLHKHFRKRMKMWQTRFRCPKCMMVLPNSCSFAAHQRIHDVDKGAPFVCPQCGDHITASRDVFMRHIKLRCLHFYHQVDVGCPNCEKSLKLGADLENHLISEHTDKYNKCLICPLAFRTNAAFSRHWAEKHPDVPEESKKTIFKCPCPCKQILQSADVVGSHIQKMLAEHTERNPLSTSYHCQHCSNVYHALPQFRRHLLEGHGVGVVDELCRECGAEFRLNLDLLIHTALEHSPEVTQKYIVASFSCSGCSKAFSDQASLDSHECEKACVKCGATFPDQEALDRHWSTQHTKLCLKCNMKVGEGGPYEAHMRKHAFVERKRQALQAARHRSQSAESGTPAAPGGGSRETSPASSTTSSTQPGTGAGSAKKRMRFPEVGVEEYGREFHGQVPTAPPPKARFPCSECPEKFRCREDLTCHLQEEHRIAPTFPCHLCGNTYPERDTLERHIKVFHEGRPSVPSAAFACFICHEKRVTLSFPTRRRLEKHLLSVHKIARGSVDVAALSPTKAAAGGDAPRIKSEDLDDDSRDSDAAAPAAAAEETGDVAEPIMRLRVVGDATFTCAKCGRRDSDRAAFLEHIEKHRSENSDAQQCQECGLCFSVFPSLKRHLFMVHKIRNFTKYKEQTGVGLKPNETDEEESPIKKRRMEEAESESIMNSVKLNGTVSPMKPPSQTDGEENGDLTEERQERKRPRREYGGGDERDVDSLEALTCNVCYKEFEEAGKLRKHMRTHGMAFIKSKRSKVPQWFDE